MAYIIKNRPRSKAAAFTLVEIMIVVAIIGLLAAMALPGFIRARKQSQGRRALNDIRQMDAAIDQWALDNGKADGAAIDTNQCAIYMKPNNWEVLDPLGNAYVIGVVGPTQIRIHASTKTALAGVGIDWGAW